MKLSIKPTPNKYELWAPPVAIVLHTTLSSLESAVDWLRMTPEERLRKHGKKSYSSAHAVIGRLGEVVELAGVDFGTWHAGVTHKPTQRAKAVIPKDIFGRIKNPNRYTIGLEFASGWDIDRDGVLETWEKLYTPQQIKGAVEYVLDRVEPQILEKHGVDIQFAGATTITHKDVTSYKPDLEIQRSMFLAELSKQRKLREEQEDPVEPPATDEIVIKAGDRLEVESIDGNIIKLKV